MTIPLVIETVDIDMLVIDKAAQQVYLLEQYRRPLICSTKFSHVSNINLQFMFPFAYIDHAGRYSIFANWNCLPEKRQSAQTIQVCLFEKAPTNIQLIAWYSLFDHLTESVHPDQAIRFVFEIIERCPATIREKLFETGMKHTAKSITGVLCDVGIQRPRSIAEAQESLAFLIMRELQ